jgi:predicted RNase H-like HicB family nuclease
LGFCNWLRYYNYSAALGGYFQICCQFCLAASTIEGEAMKLSYPACFTKDEDSDTHFVVVPDLPGCMSWGDSLTEAIAMGIDAASGWILTYLEEGRSVPPPIALKRNTA